MFDVSSQGRCNIAIMKIETLHLIEGARWARGLTVVMDIFRAFTATCYLADQYAKEIIPGGNTEIAYKLK